MHKVMCVSNLSIDMFFCIDIDECEIGVHDCTQICNNTVGRFLCSCNDGYQIDSDNRTCECIYFINCPLILIH